MYLDTHAHLCDERLLPRAQSIVENMPSDNLAAIINASYDIVSSQTNLELANKFAGVFAVVGIHPDHAKSYKLSELNEIEQMLNNKKVLAIGEIGLDYYYGKDDREEQIKLFKLQLDMAARTHVPVCLHIRDAYGDAFEILKEYKGKINKILFHCYSGSPEFMQQTINYFGDAVYFAFGGVSTFKNAVNVVAAIEKCPLNKILTETDCPYLTPVPFRGKCDNEPKFVKFVCDKIAEIKNLSSAEVQTAVLNNAREFFGGKFNVK